MTIPHWNGMMFSKSGMILMLLSQRLISLRKNMQIWLSKVMTIGS